MLWASVDLRKQIQLIERRPGPERLPVPSFEGVDFDIVALVILLLLLLSGGIFVMGQDRPELSAGLNLASLGVAWGGGKYTRSLRQGYGRALNEREFFITAMLQRQATVINYRHILAENPKVAPLILPESLPFQDLARRAQRPLCEFAAGNQTLHI